MSTTDPQKVVITIRRSEPRDVVNILRLLEQSLQENEVGYPPIDDQKLLDWILDTKRDGQILVAEVASNKRLIGVMGLSRQEYKWSREQFITNEFTFVHKSFRDKGTFDALLQQSFRYADAGGLRFVFVFSGGTKAPVKDRMMQMKGLCYAGGMFVRFPTKSG